MKIELKQIPSPNFTLVDDCPSVPAGEYDHRMAALYQAAGTDWVFVYGDREHYANLMYLTNLDPRFEEAILLLGPRSRRVMILGNEDMGYTSVVPVEVEYELCQTLSLPAQKRDTAPRLLEVLRKVGITAGQSVSVIGWKYVGKEEWDAPEEPAFLPAYFVNVLRACVGEKGKLVDGASLLIHPERGLRASNSAAQIAVFESAARNASASVFRVVQNSRPGMTEREAMRLMPYSGDPFTMHPIFASGSGQVNGLRSASGKVIQKGDAVSMAVGLMGSLVCRAGLMLDAPDQSFFDELVVPYFQVIAAWYRSMRIGAPGGEVFRVVSEEFSKSRVQSALNPGHLGSFEEWLHSPIRLDSSDRICSGMVFQVDIIPSPMEPGEALNCEDTVAVADAALRAEIKAGYPEMWSRIQARRQLMIEGLGLEIPEEILPLSDGAAYLPPFWLASGLVCTACP